MDRCPFHEQPARAVLLKEMIGAKILSIQELTAEHFDSERLKRLRPVRKSAPKSLRTGLSGGDVLDKALTGLFGR